MDDQNPKKNNYKKWLVLMNIPFQMGIIIFLFSFLGKWLDEKYPNSNNIYLKAVTMLGVAIALYNVIKQVNNLNKNQ
jgi:F0F1-type ATP synthase assembly protein I